MSKLLGWLVYEYKCGIRTRLLCVFVRVSWRGREGGERERERERERKRERERERVEREIETM